MIALPGRARCAPHAPTALALAFAFALAPLTPASSATAADGADATLAMKRATARVDSTLAHHPQGQQIAAWLRSAPERERQAAEFLLAWMPASDLGSVSAGMLRAEVREALATWDATPWAADTPPALFFHYVLPYRVSQEQPDSLCRPTLRAALAERVAGLDLPDAAIEVNRWCNEQVDFVSTSARDQPPLVTLARGWGRCEERMILAIAAMRAVGIPARACSTPWWTTTDNNHAWLEAWTGAANGWGYLEACDGSTCMNHAWFSRPAQRAGVVISTAWGEAPSAAVGGDHFLRSRHGVTLINSTATYTDPGRLLIPELADSVEVAVNAFNYGGFFPLVHVKGGESIELGPGDYLLSTEINGRMALDIARIRPGKEFRATLEHGAEFLRSPHWLRYPHLDRPLAECPKPAPTDARWLRHKLDRETNLRRRDVAEAAGRDWIVALADSSTVAAEFPPAALEDAMERAGNARGAWEKALLALDGDAARTAFRLVQEMDAKDFRELSADALPALTERMLELRARYAPDLADSTWQHYVISPRLYYQAGTQGWWQALPLAPPGTSAGALLQRFRDHVRRAPESVFGHVATPEQTWRSGWADGASAKACLTALLRIHGIPARAVRGRATIDYRHEGAWVPMRPFPEANGGTTTAAAAADAEGNAAPAAHGHLLVHYSANGAPFQAISTWRQTLLSRFEDGGFHPVYEGQLYERDGAVAWDLAPGDYWLSAGLRNSLGEPRFFAEPVTIVAADTLRLNLEIGIPLDELDEGSILRRKLDLSLPCPLLASGHGSGHGAAAATTDLRALLPAHEPVVILLLASDHEPSARHRQALLAQAATLPTIITIQLPGSASTAGNCATANATTPPPAGSYAIDAATAKALFGITNPTTQAPLSILLDRTHATRIWMTGMQQGLADLIRARLRETGGGAN